MKFYLKKFKLIILLISTTCIAIFNTIPSFCFFYNYYVVNNNVDSSITVTGDSYAGWFATFESYKDRDIFIYADPGKSTAENLRIMEEAINSPSKIFLISIGVNDHYKSEPVLKFKQRITYLVELCALRGKKVFLHTYMPYTPSNSHLIWANTVADYDDSLKEIANKYKHVHYIDMSDYKSDIYLQQDKIHYGKLFYDALYDRLSMSLFLLN